MHDLVERYTDAALHGARADAADIAAHVLTDGGLSAVRVIDELLAPSQRIVGERWQSQRCSVGDEHAATFVTESVLSSITVGLEPMPHRGTFVMACAEGEWHSLPSRMASELLILDGWRVIHLGPATPAAALRSYLAGIEADVVGISVTCAANLVGAARSVGVARHVGMTTIVGGVAFGDDPRRARAIGAHGWVAHLRDGLDLERVSWDDPRPVPVDGAWADLDERRDDITADALSWLEDRHPWASDDDATWTNRVVAELHETIDVVAGALLCDDPRIAAEHRSWLESLGRDTSSTALGGVAFDAVRAVVGRSCPAATELFDATT